MLVKNNRNGLHHVGDLHFLPGLNEVDEKAFAEAAKLPAFKAMIDDGTFEPVESKAGKTISAGEVTKLAEKEAVSLIKETFARDLLMGWRQVETRVNVLDAIQAQLDTIDPTKSSAE